MAERVIVVNGLPGSGKTTLATRLGAVLGVPVISKDVVKEALLAAVPAASWRGLGAIAMEAAWSLTTGMDGTVILESWWFRPRDGEVTEVAWRRCGAPEVVEVWCDVPADIARARAASRIRHPMHGDSGRSVDEWQDWSRRAAPLGLGAVVRVDTSVEVDVASVVHELSGPAGRPCT